jgi:hypothetical protein
MKNDNGYVPMRQGFALSEEAEVHAIDSCRSDEDDDNIDRVRGMSSFMEQNQKDYETQCERAEEDYPEYKAICKNATVVEDIACDCWGALVFCVVKDLPDLRAGRAVLEGKVRFLFCFFAFVLNYIIQSFLLYYIFKLLMLPGLRGVQNVYADFHARIWLDATTFNATAFNEMSGDKKDTLCGLALGQSVFLRVVLFLWVSTNVGEIRDNWSKTVGTFMMPRLPDGLDTRLMVRDLPQAPTTEYCVCCLNMKGKVGLFVMVWLPKFIIGISLSLMGSVWLMASENIGDLILNSLALGFVVRVDELIAMSFFPKKMIEDIEDLCLLLPGDPEKNEDELMKTRAYAFFQQSLVIGFAMGVVQCVVTFQPVLPNYAYDVSTVCVDYINQQIPWCHPFRNDCFPYGVSLEPVG